MGRHESLGFRYDSACCIDFFSFLQMNDDMLVGGTQFLQYRKHACDDENLFLGDDLACDNDFSFSFDFGTVGGVKG